MLKIPIIKDMAVCICAESPKCVIINDTNVKETANPSATLCEAIAVLLSVADIFFSAAL